MNCVIGTINKKINSTKTSFTSSSTHNVVTKNTVSRERPTLLVTGEPLKKSNYMSFNGWYYWIDDIIAEGNNLFSVTGHVDPLATFKSDIKGTSAFVNFGPSSMWNKLVCDSRCVPEVEEDINTTSATWKDVFDYKKGCVVMSVINYGDGSDMSALEGGVHFIVGSFAAFTTCMSYYGSDLLTSLTNPSYPWQQGVENVIAGFVGMGQGKDYIRSAIWVPFKFDTVKAGLSQYTGGIGPYRIYGDWYETSLIGAGCTDAGSKNVVIPYPSVCSTYWWLKSPEYSTVMCSTPGGIHDISTSDDVNETAGFRTVNANLYYSVCSGDCMIVIRDTDGDILDVAQWNCSVDVMNRTESPALSAAQVAAPLGLKVGALAVSGMSAAVGYAGSTVAGVESSLVNAGYSKGNLTAFSNFANSASSLSNIGKGMANGVNEISSGISGQCKPPNMNGGCHGISLSSSISNIYINKDMVTLQIICKTFVPTTIKKGTYESWCDEYGYPVYDYKTLSSNGYYECAGASCKTTAPQHLASTINSYLNSGIYIE